MAKKQAPAKTKKPKTGEPVYTVMAFITFVAIAVGCTLLYLDFEDYGKQSPPKENPPALPALGGAPAGVVAKAPQ
jgi:hypothetical protein